MARDYGITGLGIDMSPLFCGQARLRAQELGVAGQVEFVHAERRQATLRLKGLIWAACVGATWIGGGVAAPLSF